ncbi:hypothetical protein [Paenibacillus sp. OSY-SE]|nr:hypothetical protein [Paenibacillus sp. OSY-SE]
MKRIRSLVLTIRYVETPFYLTHESTFNEESLRLVVSINIELAR